MLNYLKNVNWLSISNRLQNYIIVSQEGSSKCCLSVWQRKWYDCVRFG